MADPASGSLSTRISLSHHPASQVGDLSVRDVIPAFREEVVGITVKPDVGEVVEVHGLGGSAVATKSADAAEVGSKGSWVGERHGTLLANPPCAHACHQAAPLVMASIAAFNPA